jgi:hypothetical protein
MAAIRPARALAERRRNEMSKPPAPARNAPDRNGFPERDPFATHQHDRDLAKEGSRPRRDPRRNTGDLPESERPSFDEPSGRRKKEAPPSSGGA